MSKSIGQRFAALNACKRLMMECTRESKEIKLMPKKKNTAAKSTVKDAKLKLTPEQRSQVAKDRWAKRRSITLSTDDPNGVEKAVEFVNSDTPVVTVSTETPATDSSVIVTVDTLAPYVSVPDGTVLDNPAMQELKEKYDALLGSMKANTPAASQLVSVKAPKQKKYTGPKEFSVALKTAENRLAKAILERAQAAGHLAALQAEIPSLLQIIAALKGPQNFVPGPPHDFVPTDFAGHYFPNALGAAPYVDPLAALQGAQPTPPVSRAQGGAMQFSPEMVGTLEGPEDDDEDRFITGHAAGGSGWIGG